MSEEKSESKDLVVKTFTNDSIANYKSYGDKSLVENLQNAEVAINKVQYTERIWDRSRSQFMLKHLTCSQADNWTRLRQVSAEMARKRMALNEAKFGYMEAVAKAKIKKQKHEQEVDPLKRELLEIQVAKMDSQNAELLVKVEGALKEIETLAEMHDQLKEIIGDVSEEEFEKAQVQSHIKRAMTQSIREVREKKVIGCGNQEYLEQVGVCVTSAMTEIQQYLVQERTSGVANTSLLHSFVDDFAERYEPVAKQQADFLGFSADANNLLTYTPTEKDNQKQLEE
jgi:DNA repair ATPase RecN